MTITKGTGIFKLVFTRLPFRRTHVWQNERNLSVHKVFVGIRFIKERGWNMSKRLLVFISIILTLVMLAGCGGGTSSSGTSGGGTPSGGTSGSGTSGSGGTMSSGGTMGNVVSDGGTSAPSAPERSRIVTVGFGSPSQLDPHNFSTYGDELAIRFCFESIIYTPRDGTGYQSGLAKSWDIAPDGTSWTFYLQEGVFWTNGDPFNADDVVYSVERVINNSPEINFKNQYLPTLAGVEKINDYTVKISFTGPTPLAGNGFRAFYIIPRKVHEQHGDSMFYDQGKDYFMVGTGPWIVDEWVDGQYIHYLKNHNYWNKAKFDSYFEEVYTRQISEASTGVAAHIVGDLDVFTVGGGIPLDYVPLYSGTEDRIELINVLGNGWFWFGFQFENGSMWNDKDIRLAYDLALNRQLIIDTLYQGTGASLPYGHFGHPSMEGFDKSLGVPEFDPNRARELLANSTYDGRKFELLVTGNTAQYEQLAMTLMDMLTSVGFNMEVTLETAANTMARINAGDYDVFLNIGSFPDGIIQRQMNRILLDGDKTHYRNDELLSYVNGYLTEVDVAKRKEYARLANQFIFEEKAPFITLLHRSVIHAQNYGITGVSYPPDGVFSHVYIDWDPTLIPHK